MANPQIAKTFPSGERLCATEDDTRRAAHDLAACLGDHAILSLEGPMGAGKTCFVKGLAEALGCDPRDVSSPTFTLIHEYHGGRLTLVHMDLYRIESATDLAPLGFDDYLAGDGIVAIEWGGKFADELPPHTLRLLFSIKGPARLIQIRP
jgi:tRNA threonylcarbamoyladenosine biosynthesis protein TsaE